MLYHCRSISNVSTPSFFVDSPADRLRAAAGVIDQPVKRIAPFTGEMVRGMPDVTAMIRTCGELPVSTRLMDEMIAYRTEGFAAATGFEDLEL